MARPKTIGYTRVSTAEQVDGFGLDAQEAAIRSYCKAQGLQLVAMLSDHGQSGSNGLDTRLGLAEGLARIERGEASSLVVYRLDRLARDLILQETLIARLEECGATVDSISDPAMEDADDYTRKMVRQMLGVIADYERAVIRGRMMAGKAAKVAGGGYGGGRPGYGFKAQDGELVADESEAVIVSTVTTMRSDGASYRTIAAALADAGHMTRSGGQWNPNQVRRIAMRSGVA